MLYYLLAKNGANLRKRQISNNNFDISIYKTEIAQTIQNSTQKINIRNLYSKIISIQVIEKNKAI